MIDFEFWESIAMTEMVALMGQLINQKQYLNYDVIFIFKIKNENKNQQGRRRRTCLLIYNSCVCVCVCLSVCVCVCPSAAFNYICP